MTVKNYKLVESEEELEILCSVLLRSETPIGLDCETGYDGLDKAKAQFHPEEGFVVGISITNSLDWARYIPLRHDFYANLDNTKAAELLYPVLYSGLCVPHNADFELRMLSAWLRSYVMHIPEVYSTNGYFKVRSDTQIEAAVLSEWPKQGLKDLVYMIFDHNMTHFEDLFPGVPESKKKCLRFNTLELTPEVVAYACEDALWALALHELNYPKVKDNFIYKLEMAIVNEVLHEMEDDGLLFDWEAMRETSLKAKEFLAIQYAEIQATLSKMVGRQVAINLNSPKQVSDMLYGELGFKTTRMTKSSKDGKDPKMSADAKALEGLAKAHPVIRQILEYKEVSKLITSYLDKYERDFAYDSDTNRVHPSYNQSYVVSGRFSVSDPGIQQLPAGNFEIDMDTGEESTRDTPDDRKKKITRYHAGGHTFELCFRDFVIAPEGYYGVGFDLSQAELRALAGESGEPALVDAYTTGVDVHVRAASMLFGVPEDQVTKVQRGKGKTLNFSLLYGQGIKALGESLGVPYEEAEELYNKYFESYSKIAEYVTKQNAFGRQKGYVMSKFGRKMTIWDYKDPGQRKFMLEAGDRKTVNYPIQSSATGDFPKIAMVRAKKAIRDAGFRDKIQMVMNVHDALEFYVHESLPFQQVIDLLEPAVIFPVQGWPPMVADWHIWKKWGSAQDVVRNSDGIWVLKEQKIKDTESTEPVLEDLVDCLVIKSSSPVSHSRLDALMDLVEDNPGDVYTILVQDGVSIRVGESSLGEEDSFTLSRILGDTVVYSERQSKSLVDSLVKELTLQ